MAQKKRANGTSAPSSEDATAPANTTGPDQPVGEATEVKVITNGTFEVQLEGMKTQKEPRAVSTCTNRGVPMAGHHRGPALYILRKNQRIQKKNTTGAGGRSTEGRGIVTGLAPRSWWSWKKEEWPPRSNTVILPQYDGEIDPGEFLLKCKATVESNGRISAIKAKASVLALKGSAQHWYASLPKGYICSWGQLRSKLLTSFRGLNTEELTSCDFHNCKQGQDELLQDYMQRIALCKKSPIVTGIISLK
ncbi:uncharacterized protein C2845_PM13G12290 [Panicum miliaceum]|uniref:Retrotransposon gag domain-containing protein n=1 Tax=Panicum miliaceum TaxID=4540 RepID=A0A3L6RHJ4_PANMI|nr:uncharacterized protein C2845_PM13G12290 [Panicum miliaceum]